MPVRHGRPGTGTGSIVICWGFSVAAMPPKADPRRTAPEHPLTSKEPQGMAFPVSAYIAKILPPLPRFGHAYAADQIASFRRGFLHLGIAVLTEVCRSRGSLISGSE
jgi:hypothetical protein